MKPHVYAADYRLEWSDFRCLATQTLQTDWRGHRAKSPVSFCLVKEPGRFHFLVHFPANDLGDASAVGRFRAQLWEGNVAELFVADDSTRRYQEFNLAPSGEWWSAVFSDTRVATESELEVVTGVEVAFDSESGLFRLSAAESFLQLQCAFDSRSRLNVCSIWGNDPRCFCSSAQLPGETPDFHQPEHFEQIELSNIS
ncbi:MAG: hypothetical protein KDD66_04940 [Bdellovibrionales bacterium]|nr:hypothetical protein [Bdellovibrionales bacterium]